MLKMNETSLKNNTINFNDDVGAALLRSILLAKNSVPPFHKRVADNYVVIKRMYNWVTLLYSRNCPNIVNQLYFNLKKLKNKQKA